MLLKIIKQFITYITYAFNADDIKYVNTYIDQQRLDIEKRITKYYNDFLFQSDSLIAEWGNFYFGASIVPRFWDNEGKNPDRWSEYEYFYLYI